MDCLPRLRVHFEITDRCNLNCRHCFKRRETHDTPYAVIEHVLVEGRGLHIDHASFGGGEPTLHPEFPRIVARAVELGYTVTTVSNGRDFASTWEWMRGLPARDGRPSVGMAFSLDGPNAEVHDAMRASGSFEAVTRALALCRVAHIPTTTKTVVTSVNRDHLERIVRFVSGMGCVTAEFAGMIPTESGLESGVLLDPGDLRKAAADLDRLGGVYSTHVYRDVTLGHTCFAVACDPFRSLSFSVDVHGRLSLCCMLSNLSDSPEQNADVVGDLSTESLVSLLSRFHRKARSALSARARLLAERDPSPAERFPCALCAAYFGKLDWLANHRSSQWSPLLEAFPPYHGDCEEAAR